MPTCAVTGTIRDQSLQPIPLAEVTVVLDRVDRYQGFVLPRRQVFTADSNGQFTADLFPNELGTTGSQYRFSARNSDNRVVLDVFATVPNQPTANLYLIAELDPPGTLSDAQSASLAAQGFAVSANASAGLAADAVAAAGDASRLEIGTVTTLDPGTAATAEIVGDPGAQSLNLQIPRGDEGLPGAIVIPPGGTTGQILAKASGSDFDLIWINPPVGQASGIGSIVAEDDDTLTVLFADGVVIAEDDDTITINDIDESLIVAEDDDTITLEIAA